MPLPKGVSGNPSGSSKEQARLRLLAQRKASEYLEAAIDVHVRVMNDFEAPHAAQVAAANSIIDRACGKAVAPVEHSGEITHQYVIETPSVAVDVIAWQSQHGTKQLVQ